MELQYDPHISFLDIYLKEMKSAYERDTCVPMFIRAIFIICLVTDEWEKKIWYIHTQ
jgi:hypothetical protein